MARREPKGLFARVEGLPIIIVFLCMLALFMWMAPLVFLAPNIYMTFLSTLPPLMVLALGLTFVIAAGEIDLSFPSILAFSGFVFAVLFKDYHLGWFAAIAAVLAGTLVGWFNGLLIARVGIPSFIATLGTQFFWAGMATVLSGGRSYALRGVEASAVWRVLDGRIGGNDPLAWYTQVSMEAVWTAALVVFLWFIMNRHRFGEHVLFLGDSNDVSRVVGIPVAREKIRLFSLMGTLAGVAAVMLTLENRNYFGDQGSGYLLTAIAAVLIGGTSILGGRATIVGTVFGALIMGMLEAGLVASGLTGAWVRTAQGLIFLIAIVFYLLADEPARREALLGRFGLARRSGGRAPKPGSGAAPAAKL